jgi:hypothetical protein
MLSDRQEQLKPLGLGKRNKTLGTVIDGVECFAGNAIGCAKTVDDYKALFQEHPICNSYHHHHIYLHLISV